MTSKITDALMFSGGRYHLFPIWIRWTLYGIYIHLTIASPLCPTLSTPPLTSPPPILTSPAPQHLQGQGGRSFDLRPATLHLWRHAPMTTPGIRYQACPHPILRPASTKGVVPGFLASFLRPTLFFRVFFFRCTQISEMPLRTDTK